jgi:hypothetical protein
VVDEKFAELDVKRIELDSLDVDSEPLSEPASLQSKLWTVILRHEARNFQEISVSPGMLVSVIRTFNDWIYVRLVGFENSNLALSQQYGMLPKSCVADLNAVILNSQRMMTDTDFLHSRSGYFLNKSRRKSHQITAL